MRACHRIAPQRYGTLPHDFRISMRLRYLALQRATLRIAHTVCGGAAYCAKLLLASSPRWEGKPFAALAAFQMCWARRVTPTTKRGLAYSKPDSHLLDR